MGGTNEGEGRKHLVIKKLTRPTTVESPKEFDNSFKVSEVDAKVSLHDLKARRQFTQEQIVHLLELKNMHGIDIEEYVKRPAILSSEDGVAVIRTNPVRLFDENVIIFEERNVTCKIITTIKRFRIVKDIDTLSSYGNARLDTPSYIEGDILEERFDMPNVFVNISKLERNPKLKSWQIDIKLSNINNQQYYVEKHFRPAGYGLAGMTLIDNPAFGAFEPIDEIDAKDSEYLQRFGKRIISVYKRKRKQLASITEELTNLRGVLGIENED